LGIIRKLIFKKDTRPHEAKAMSVKKRIDERIHTRLLINNWEYQVL